jgi:hypothetical protein
MIVAGPRGHRLLHARSGNAAIGVPILRVWAVTWSFDWLAQDDVIMLAVATASRRWLAEHTAAHFVAFSDETQMLSHAFADGALRFTAEPQAAGN